MFGVVSVCERHTFPNTPNNKTNQNPTITPSKKQKTIKIPSDKVPFNQAPDMKAAEITAAGIEALRSGACFFVVVLCCFVCGFVFGFC